MLLTTCKRECGGCTVQALKIVTFTAVNWQRAWGLAPVTLLYVSNVAFALMGLQNLNIPMYNTLKRLTPVIVLITKVFLGVIPLLRHHTVASQINHRNISSMVLTRGRWCVWQAVQTKKSPPQDIAASVILVVAGCVVAGIGDFSFDLKGCDHMALSECS